jgi:Ca-activated chloride channel family protein
MPSGTGVLEVVSETGDADKARLFVPLQKSSLTGTFHGPLGSLVLSQTFRFSKDVISTPIEAIYRFPLPGDAAVSEVVVTFGEEIIRTKLMERAAAEKTYDEAFEKGKKAVLVTRESPDVFTLHLTGILPDTDVTVQTTFTLLARVIPQGWEIRVPFTIGPRYTRSDEKHPGIQAQPLLSAADPGYRVSMDLWLRPGVQVITITPKADIVQISGATRIKIQNMKPDRDLVLKWTIEKEKKMLTAWSSDDPISGHRYILSLINPGNGAKTVTIPREMVLVVDQSGSMHGGKWDAAKKSLFALLDTLEEGEFFNVCIFSDKPVWCSTRGQIAATRENVKAAKAFVSSTSLFNGTELGIALEQATAQRKQPGTFSRHIIVITDGQVTDEARIFKVAEKERSAPDARRVSVITIDSSPNTYLTEELARLGGGTAKFLEDNGQVQAVLEELLLCWQQPVVNDAVLTSNGQDLDVPGFGAVRSNSGRAVDIGDIRPGMPLFLCGRIPLTEQETMMTLSSGESGHIAATTPEPGDGNLGTALKTLFGSAKIRALEYIHQAGHPYEETSKRLKDLGYDLKGSENSSVVYPENRKGALEEQLKQLIISESLRYGIPSSFTGFIGVSEHTGIVPQVTVAVPNAMPAGWDTGSLCCPSALSDMDYHDVDLASFEMKKASPRMPIMMKADIGHDFHEFSNVRPSGRRSPQQQAPVLYDVVHAIRDINGETVLFENIPVKKGHFTIILKFRTKPDGKDVRIRFVLDGCEIGTWDMDGHRQGQNNFGFDIAVPAKGILKAVLLDPYRHFGQKEVEVILMADAGGERSPFQGIIF